LRLFKLGLPSYVKRMMCAENTSACHEAMMTNSLHILFLFSQCEDVTRRLSLLRDVTLGFECAIVSL
jgi:hypothetical protein